MGEKKKESRASEELRAAVERTFAAAADSAAGTRDRAQDLLDDAVRLGQDARNEALRRGSEAKDVVEKELESLRKRIAELESSLGRSRKG